MPSRKQLLAHINEVSFAVNDISLYLNTHPEEAARYSDLKRQLLTTCNGDRYAFGTGKEPFIQSIYQKLGF